MPTLPCEELEEEKQTHIIAIRHAVARMVKQGLEEERVTVGIQLCVQLMNSSSESVMLCLLIPMDHDATIKIPLLLIRAFCQENDIDFLHLHEDVKLVKTCLTHQAVKCRGDVIIQAAPTKVETGVDAVGCIMIKYPKNGQSPEDYMVADYIKEKMNNHSNPSVTYLDPTQAGIDKRFGFKLKTKKQKTQLSPEVASIFS